MTASLLALILILTLLSTTSRLVLSVPAPSQTNSFAAQVDAQLIATNPTCAAAIAQVQSDLTLTQCFGPDTSLFFATQNVICDGEAYPGAPHRNPKCLPATVSAARLIAAKCPVNGSSDRWGKETVYKAWSNHGAARDACTLLPDPLADDPSAGPAHAIFQVYQSMNVWRNWKWDGVSEVTLVDKRKALCTLANKVYWRNVEVVGEQPSAYFMVLGENGEVGEFVKDIKSVCGFKVPAMGGAKKL